MNEADTGDTRMPWVVVTAVLVQVLIVTIWVWFDAPHGAIWLSMAPSWVVGLAVLSSALLWLPDREDRG